jgi:hypothetical protein
MKNKLNIQFDKMLLLKDKWNRVMKTFDSISIDLDKRINETPNAIRISLDSP